MGDDQIRSSQVDRKSESIVSRGKKFNKNMSEHIG